MWNHALGAKVVSSPATWEDDPMLAIEGQEERAANPSKQLRRLSPPPVDGGGRPHPTATIRE
jgi:hypothetical protein